MTADGKVALITGASRGIGEATALGFAAAGWRVALTARDGAAVGKVAARIGPESLALTTDVADWSAMQAAVAATLARFGRLDALVNNAALVDPIARIGDADPAAWGHLITVNVTGAFHGIRAVLPAMLAGGGGTVITLSSGAARNPHEGWSAYGASRAATAMLTRSLHLEYAAQGIVALGLSPGTVATRMQRAISASGLGPVSQLDWSAHIPPEWVARALVWMAGPDGAAHAGEELSLRDEALKRRIGLC